MLLKTDLELLEIFYDKHNHYPKYMDVDDYYSKERLILAKEYYNKYQDPYAATIIGSFYHGGYSGVDIDLNKAIYWYIIGFEEGGNINTGFELSRIYTHQQKYQKAFDVYTKLTTINHHQALTALGAFYKNGWYVKQDYNKALEYFILGEKYGNLQAPAGSLSMYAKQKKYIKFLLMLVKIIIIIIPKRIYSLFNGTLESKTRVI